MKTMHLWDMTPSPPSKLTPSAVKSLDKKRKKVGSPTLQSTSKMSPNSTPHDTKEKWIASQQDSLAKILASLATAQDSKGQKVGCFTKSSESLAFYDPPSSSWKTHQLSLFEDLTKFSEKWPKSGMIVNGQYYPLKRSALPMSESAGGACAPAQISTRQLYPTPTARDYRQIGPSDAKRHTPSLAAVVKVMEIHPGQLNPTFVEWLMGTPIGATESKP